MQVAFAVAIGGARLPASTPADATLVEKATQLAGHSAPTAVFSLGYLSRMHGNTKMLEKTRIKLESMLKSENQLGSDGIPHEIDSTTRVSLSQGSVLAALQISIKPSLSIEMGLAYGFSALLILDSMFENNYGKHVAIDPYEVTLFHGIGLKSIHDFEFDDTFEWQEALSIDALSTMRRDGVRVQYIYIDGHHTFDVALIDFCCSDKILDTGCVIILDDMWMLSMKTSWDHFVNFNTSYYVSSINEKYDRYKEILKMKYYN